MFGTRTRKGEGFFFGKPDKSKHESTREEPKLGDLRLADNEQHISFVTGERVTLTRYKMRHAPKVEDILTVWGVNGEKEGEARVLEVEEIAEPVPELGVEHVMGEYKIMFQRLGNRSSGNEYNPLEPGA